MLGFTLVVFFSSHEKGRGLHCEAYLCNSTPKSLFSSLSYHFEQLSKNLAFSIQENLIK